MSPDPAPLTRSALALAMLAAWVLLFLAVLLPPWLLGMTDAGDALTRWTVRLALVYYALAAVLMLRLLPTDWRAASVPGRLARWCWSLAWLTYVAHVIVAFHFVHHWSHRAAYEHTQQVGGFGPGIYVNYLFTLLWTADVVWWWAAPRGYAARPHRVGWLLHAFMAFVIFCATVVFEDGQIRWLGLLMFAGLGFFLLYRVRPRPWRHEGQGVAADSETAIPQEW
jgi:hypothetical protein